MIIIDLVSAILCPTSEIHLKYSLKHHAIHEDLSKGWETQQIQPRMGLITFCSCISCQISEIHFVPYFHFSFWFYFVAIGTINLDYHLRFESKPFHFIDCLWSLHYMYVNRQPRTRKPGDLFAFCPISSVCCVILKSIKDKKSLKHLDKDRIGSDRM